jgi:N-acetylmuramoyl-L-alanine amidase
VTSSSPRPGRLEVLAARARIALNEQTGKPSPAWLRRLADAQPEPPHPEPAPAVAAPRLPRATPLPPGTGKIRALAFLPARPMQGRDVLDLQRQLVALGYGEEGLIDGFYDADTEVAVRRFQTDYDILTDGVCGRVTQRVLKYLEKHHIDRHNPPTIQQRHMISFIVKAQQGGFVVIDLLSRNLDATTEREASIADSLVEHLGRALEPQIAMLTGMQSWTLDSAHLMTNDGEQIASFANNIKAELMITLSVSNSAAVGPGCATYYFGSAPDVFSHVGRPLADFVQAEIVAVARAVDRGTHPEYSPLFEQAQLPTIRVEFGNVADDRDLVRLFDDAYLESVAVGIATGVRRFYLLGQNGDDDTLLNLGKTLRS